MLNFILKILSLDIWLYYGKELQKALYPTIVILLFLAYKNRKELKINSTSLFLFASLFVIFCGRSAIFLGGLDWDSNRYLYPLTILLIPIATLGYPVLRTLFEKALKNKNSGRFLVILLIAISLIQILRPKTPKVYLEKPIEMIQQMCPSNNAVIINNLKDSRLSYHAKAKDIKYKPKYIKNKLKKIENLSNAGKEVFIYMKNPLLELQKQMEPFTLIREFKHKKDVYILYKYGLVDYSKIEPLDYKTNNHYFFFSTLLLSLCFICVPFFKKIRNKILNTSDIHIVFIIFMFALLICLPTIIFIDIPDKISLLNAPTIFTKMSEVIAKSLKLDLFTSKKIISSIFFALTIFPLYFMQKAVFSKNISILLTYFFLLCYPFDHYNYSSSINTISLFLMILILFVLQKFIIKENKYKVTILLLNMVIISNIFYFLSTNPIPYINQLVNIDYEILRNTPPTSLISHFCSTQFLLILYIICIIFTIKKNAIIEYIKNQRVVYINLLFGIFTVFFLLYVHNGIVKYSPMKFSLYKKTEQEHRNMAAIVNNIDYKSAALKLKDIKNTHLNFSILTGEHIIFKVSNNLSFNEIEEFSKAHNVDMVFYYNNKSPLPQFDKLIKSGKLIFIYKIFNISIFKYSQSLK